MPDQNTPGRPTRGSSVRPMALLLLVAGLSASAVSAQRGALLEGVPDAVDPAAEYLIYLHGRIIETQGRRPTHPTFGVYEYDAILRAFADRGYRVIGEARPADTRIGAYADHVADQVRQLIAAGVPPGHIAVVGFSKGGMITIATSSRLDVPEVRYVILAGCTSTILGDSAMALTGRVLSIHEASDDIGRSCKPLFDRSPGAREKTERRISTGARHGAFYTPRSEWMEPLFRWLGAP